LTNSKHNTESTVTSLLKLSNRHSTVDGASYHHRKVLLALI